MAEGSSIGEEAELDGALIGRKCRIEARARLREGSALGDGVSVGEEATISPGASVYPDEFIQSGTEIIEDVY